MRALNLHVERVSGPSRNRDDAQTEALTDTAFSCGIVQPKAYHAEVGESFPDKSTKVNIISAAVARR